MGFQNVESGAQMGIIDASGMQCFLSVPADSCWLLGGV